ncbi:uncharacterized protein SOCE26_067210 [Sorangium cellulosum]|uniref:SMB domain-containing protein n=2 Tax=Sorangium cellulosum TaxID=56 RepID=A0A2L0F110_SORCE|nr:uncharacterized protein SOCE26_067210 [Sorangium cellulosum]
MEEDHYPEFGGMCRAGHERVRVDVSWTGNIACEFAGWVNPDNPADCRARIHVHTNAFWGGGECRATSFEGRSNLFRCAGRREGEDHCGGGGPLAPNGQPACFCDDACELNGDCCPDYHRVCE